MSEHVTKVYVVVGDEQVVWLDVGLDFTEELNESEIFELYARLREELRKVCVKANGRKGNG